MTLWYVDNSLGTGSNNGTSWANAWRTIGAVVWGGAGVVAGDTLYLSGGTTSQSYTGSGSTTILTIGASGSAGLPITVSGGIDAGHNGAAIIDGQSGGRDCIDIISRTFVTIQNLTCQNPGGGFDTLWCTGCGNIIIQNNIMHVGGTATNAHSVGIDVRSTTAAVTVQNNYIDTGVNILDQTDCIYAQNCVDGLLIDNNNIHQLNFNSNGHNDGIQLGLNGNVTVSNNYIEIPIGGNNVHGMLLSDPNGTKTYTAFNNVINSPNGADTGINLQNVQVGTLTASASGTVLTVTALTGTLSVGQDLRGTGVAALTTIASFGTGNGTSTGTYNLSVSQGTLTSRAMTSFSNGTINLYNNTIYVDGTVAFGISLADLNPLSEIKNNIIWASGSSGIGINNAGWTPTATTQIDYNDIFPSNGAVTFSGSTTNWNAAHGIGTNPTFVKNDVDFHLQATSPCRNTGLTIGSITVDKDGNPRPAGSAYDIGAYEYVVPIWLFRPHRIQIWG